MSDCEWMTNERLCSAIGYGKSKYEICCGNCRYYAKSEGGDGHVCGNYRLKLISYSASLVFPVEHGFVCDYYSPSLERLKAEMEAEEQRDREIGYRAVDMEHCGNCRFFSGERTPSLMEPSTECFHPKCTHLRPKTMHICNFYEPEQEEENNG